MKIVACAFLCLCLATARSFSQDSTKLSQDTITARIVLVGDAGKLTNGQQPVVSAIRKMIPMDKRTSIIYLGDNSYENGLPDEQFGTYNAVRAVLDSQLFVADGTKANVYMIPGNHDWKNGKSDGYDAILREQRYTDGLNRPNVNFYPKDGCPGPVEVQLGPTVWAVIFDSQWWIHTFEKPGIESDCECKTQEEVVTLIQDILSRHAKDLVIMCDHHPFKSNGVHGGFFKLKQHIFPFTDVFAPLYIPLPLIGSIYPIARSVFGVPQDLKHPNYLNMVSRITEVTKDYKNIIFAAGHEHTLQLIQDSSYNYIVSGAGSKHQRVSKSKKSPYVSSHNGFCVLEISKNKNVNITFYEVSDSVHVGYTNNIFNFTTVVDPIADSINRIVANPNLKYQDTITISASDKYITHSPMKKFFMGNNYRKEWETPVNMRVFNLSKEKGGFKVVSFGGGKASRSLTLRDTANRLWVLRSIDKDPSKAIPQNFRTTLAADLVQDFISASQPYAPLTIPELSEPLGLVVPRPELFFVPDDRAFGSYQRFFAKTVCLLEEREPTANNEKVMNSIQVFDKILDESDHRIDQPLTLKARLLDILIGDFDRHLGQWKWARGDTGKGKLYIPIPRDRDQALFYSDGLLMKLVSKQLLPALKGFRTDIPNVNWLSESAKDFDRVFLTDLDAKEWQEGVAELQQKLNDSVISHAIQQMPPEIYALDGPLLTQKLISRRNVLPSAAMKYYRFLSRNVNVVGSNQKEYFKVTSVPGGGLNVKVYGRKNNNDTSFVMFDRTFDQRVTKEIRLYGLGNDDLFDIDKNVGSHIRFRVIGGTGNDTFNINGRVQNYLYDLDEEGNYIVHRSHSRVMFTKEPPVNYYNILGFKYNRNSYPGFKMAIDDGDGFMVGLGFMRKVYGFRNEPYASLQRFSALYAITRGGRLLHYSGEFNHAIRNNDIIINSELMVPGISNFFGLGNNTEIDRTKPISFYRTRYSHFETQVLIQKRLFPTLKLMIGPVFYQYWINPKDNFGKVLSQPAQVGLDSAETYLKKTYVGGKFAIHVNNLNNELFPTRGVQWNTEVTTMRGIANTRTLTTTLRSDMAVYASLSDPAKLIAVLQFGAGRIYGDHYEYFQALTLGGGNVLRGFSKDRFAGRSMMYASVELRQKIAEVKSYIFPGTFGLVAFAETGRVWLKDEISSRWHPTYGGGIYYIPFKLAIISATIGFSNEQHLFNFSVGTKLNLNF